MSGDGENGWSLGELAERARMSRRTIRYYIARGLLPGPAGRGRGARYGREHLERLLEIRRLQEEGLTLGAVALALAGGPPRARLPEPETWHVHTIAPDVRVHVRAGGPPWRIRRIQEALERLAAEIGEENGNAPGNEIPGEGSEG